MTHLLVIPDLIRNLALEILNLVQDDGVFLNSSLTYITKQKQFYFTKRKQQNKNITKIKKHIIMGCREK